MCAQGSFCCSSPKRIEVKLKPHIAARNDKEKEKLHQSTWKLRRLQKNNAFRTFKKNQAFLASRDLVSAATCIKDKRGSSEASSQYCKTQESSSLIQKLQMKRKRTDFSMNIFLLRKINFSKPAPFNATSLL